MRGRVAPSLLSSLLALCLVAPTNALEATSSSADTTAELDVDGRYIVILEPGTDPASVLERAGARHGVAADGMFRRAIRGFSATLDADQRAGLLADPGVAAVVPDERIEATELQRIPTNISRIGATRSAIASIEGVDQRIDADIAILDTGIAIHPDLNVVGGYNCASANRAAWRDIDGHGTHVAGTAAALDNEFGVVGVAPGARLHAVRILNDDGEGLLSWYICGLDWVLTQRDPGDPTRPLFEVVNMSVTKRGSDDRNCGFTNRDPLHQAICRVVAGGITVVASAANSSRSASGNVPGAYDEVITVSALADTDGLPGGLGGNACRSFGGYGRDDTFADFSNYGGDVDIIAPGKCIFSTFARSLYATLTGTSMATPAVTGAVALYKSSRPYATPDEVREALRYLGTLDWDVSTDPDPVHEPLLDVSQMGPLGAFAIAPGTSPAPVEAGSPITTAITVTRDATFFERVALGASAPAGWMASFDRPTLFGWDATTSNLTLTAPPGTPAGRYDITASATNQRRVVSTTIPVEIFADLPTVAPAQTSIQPGVAAGSSAAPARLTWPEATDPSSPIAGYEVETNRDGGPWGQTLALDAAQREAAYSLELGASYGFRIRAKDRGGNWSPWVETPGATRVLAVDDRRSAIDYRGAWRRTTHPNALARTLSGSAEVGASARLTFTGRGVAIIAPRTRKRGVAEVYLDGAMVRRIGLWSSSPVDRHVVFARSFPEIGVHTIEWRVAGTGRHPLVELDSFIFMR
jgi:subtilisin family serine protease